MQLIFKIQKTNKKGAAPVEIILKEKNLFRKQTNRIINRETMENAEKVLEKLDKIFKKSNIGITNIKNIKTIDLNKNRYTSYRIVRSIERALKFGLTV